MASNVMRNIIKIVSITSLLSGCSLANELYDDEQNFIDVRESEIGKNIEVVMETPKYYEYSKRSKNYWNYKEPKVIKISEKYEEYYFIFSNCEWALKVNRKTKIVDNWRYVSERSLCKYRRFYEGPF